MRRSQVAAFAFSLWASAALAAEPALSQATESATAVAAPATTSTAHTPGAAASQPSQPPQTRPVEGASGKRVIEDDRVRIEETRVRGQLQSITVRSKLTGQDYEIIVGPGGRDPSQRGDAAGQRAWSLFRF